MTQSAAHANYRRSNLTGLNNPVLASIYIIPGWTWRCYRRRPQLGNRQSLMYRFLSWYMQLSNFSCLHRVYSNPSKGQSDH
ncbi:hypothetical protein BT63DRAFT_179157 [Microthyrium microscopicum]|uniref:Uncharacterized protein n=1 Tax=Microthyrium microscopicum TaxID=703497 RepID=A0A6A6UJV2_9PEZI|nr:hypothetical protein BT63DRAFT_179157 [Microthyrium microscopicum]